MTKKQHYMTYPERNKLEAFLRARKSVAWIARELGFTPKTIYNEMKRGAYNHDCGWYYETRYSADKAQQVHDWNQTAKGRPLKIGSNRRYADFLERKILTDKFSPAAALAAARTAGYQTKVCTATLYSYITKGLFLHLTNRDLWEKSKRKKRTYAPIRRVVHPKLPSITDRPVQIGQRLERGHWEMDLVVGCAGSRAVLLTLTERVTREEIMIRLPDRKAKTVRRAWDRLERSMGKRRFREKFRSITTDNGSEFLEYEQLVTSVYGGQRFQVWYCHSYAAWEKGSNENHNRMIRRFFPKGTDFTRISAKRVRKVQDWMNQYPRKVLDWKTPQEMAA